MNKNDSLNSTNFNNNPHLENILDLKKVLYLIISKWYYILFALAFALICSFLFNKYTIPVYRVSANLLIDDEKRGIQIEDNQILRGFGLGTISKNLDNQIMILSSRTLINRTLEELDFDIEYYRKELFNTISYYPDIPIKVVPDSADNLPKDVVFWLKDLNNNMFTLKAKLYDTLSFETETIFNGEILLPNGSFKIEVDNSDLFSEEKDRRIYFISHSRRNLVESYKNRLKIQPLSEDGTIVSLSLEGTNKTKDIDFLNKLIEIYLYNSLNKKNEEAIRIIQFIDDQLIGISDSLVIAENRLQQFRSTHRVMDLSAQGQAIIEQAMKLENEKARIEIEANYYSYLAEYLAKDNAGEVPIAPATIGIADPGLTKLVSDLADLQGQLYSKSLGEKNPLQSQLSQRVRTIKEALRETLSGVRRANNLARDEINSQIRTVNAQATALPVTERQLLGIERKFKLNDELYTFLLEKRAEAQIQKASNMPDNELIDSPEADLLPVKPQKTKIFILALTLSIFITVLWILISYSFDSKVREEDDIKAITDIPISGYITHSPLKKNTVVLDEPDTPISEAFRSLRSKMQFLTKEIKAPLILITSSGPAEGKTFSAINLASAYSLMGKRTLLVDFDMRKPKIHRDFDLDNNRGISTWLIGRDELQNIIEETQYKNLSVIPAGPITPNPSELIALEKTSEILMLLKEKYEYIIIDSSPIGTVSDTLNLATLVDTCILIVRQNKTLKDLLKSTLKELIISNTKGLSLVVNDLRSKDKFYVYGGRYGYS